MKIARGMLGACILVLIVGQISVLYPGTARAPSSTDFSQDWTQIGTNTTWFFQSRNTSASGTTYINNTYHFVIYTYNGTTRYAQEEVTTSGNGTWIEGRTFDRVTRAYLAFPGNYSWQWVNTSEVVGHSVELGNGAFLVDSIILQWAYSGSSYAVFKIVPTFTGYGIVAYYNTANGILMQVNITKTAPSYTLTMSYAIQSIVVRGGMGGSAPGGAPGLLPAPPSGDGTRGESQHPLTYFQTYYPPWGTNSGSSGWPWRYWVGTSIESDAYNRNNGLMYSYLRNIAGSPAGRAHGETFGWMYGVGAYHVPECGSAHFQASIQVSGSAFVVSTGFTPFTFWGYDIKLYLRAEVWNAYNVNEYYSSDSVLAEQHSFWWWTTAVPGTLWSWGGSTYPVVVNGYFCGYYSFMARFNVIQDVRVSGAGIVVAGDEVYSYLSSATFWRL